MSVVKAPGYAEDRRKRHPEENWDWGSYTAPAIFGGTLGLANLASQYFASYASLPGIQGFYAATLLGLTAFLLSLTMNVVLKHELPLFRNAAPGAFVRFFAIYLIGISILVLASHVEAVKVAQESMEARLASAARRAEAAIAAVAASAASAATAAGPPSHGGQGHGLTWPDVTFHLILSVSLVTQTILEAYVLFCLSKVREFLSANLWASARRRTKWLIVLSMLSFLVLGGKISCIKFGIFAQETYSYWVALGVDVLIVLWTLTVVKRGSMHHA